MVNLNELHDYLALLSDDLSEDEANTIRSFIDFISSEQKKKQTAGVISLKRREQAQFLKELKERQAKNKPLNPDDDFNNLPQ